MKIVVASCLIVSRSTRFIALRNLCAALVLVLLFTNATFVSYAQQPPANSGASGAPNPGNKQGAPPTNAPKSQGSSGAQGTQNQSNAQNDSTKTQGASTHSVDVAGSQIAPFFQISTSASSPIVGEPLTISRLVYQIYSPTERARRLVAYWELSGRHAYYNLCFVYFDFVNQCSQKVESKYSTGQAPQETTTLLNSLRLIAAQRCEDARLTFLQAQYDFDASFTSAAGRRAAMTRAAYSDSKSKSIGWGAAVLYVPSASPATEFYNARFEENSRWRTPSKEAARLNALLPLLYESLQSRANQAIREKDVLIGSFNASTVSESAIFGALDRYFDAQRNALDAAVRYNQAIALYVAETTPGSVQGARFLATLNQRAENEAQNVAPGAASNAPAEGKTNAAPAQNDNPAPNTSAQYAPRSFNASLPGLEYKEPTAPQTSNLAPYRAPGMDRWYYPGFDDANASAPKTFANDPVVDSVSDARVGVEVEPAERSLLPSLASSVPSSESAPNMSPTSSLNASSVDLQPAVYPTSNRSSSAPQNSEGNTEAPGAQPPAPNADEPNVQPVPSASVEPSAPPTPSGSNETAPDSEKSEEQKQEPEKPRVVALSVEQNALAEDEILAFFENIYDEDRNFSDDGSELRFTPITRAQSPDVKDAPKDEKNAQKGGNPQNRVEELARALFAPTTPEQENGQIVERTCSLAEALMRVPNSPESRFAIVDAYWSLQRAAARSRVETVFLATTTRAFNDANAANSDSARLCLAAALEAQARVAEAKSFKRSVQSDFLRVANQSVEYGYPIPSTLPFFGSNYELGTPVPDNFHTRRSGELIRSRLQAINTLGASLPTPTGAFSLDVASIADCDVLVALETLEKKRESVLLFVDSIIELNRSIAEYVSFFPARIPNERFVESLVGRN